MIKNTLAKKSNDVTDVASCTCTNIRKAARIVTQAYNDALRPVDLRSTQFTLLANLTRKGDTPLTQLAEAMVMDRTTLTRNLKPLERRQLIHIGHEKDQRVRKIGITPAGKQIFEDALPLWQEMQKQIAQGMGQQRWSDFMNDLSETVSIVQDG
ncbi:MAG: winged helix-turn-helix transcriptional regulator [Rhizobiaceae bacterium]|nr:winged helix-turn-helix transcriptional regulator [Rhizobiaceae bacterium]